MTKPTTWVSIRSNTNRSLQSQKIARSWKFWIQKVEELYYPSSENKGADQLRRYCEADLRLCFRKCKMVVCFQDLQTVFISHLEPFNYRKKPIKALENDNFMLLQSINTFHKSAKLI